MRWQGKRYLLWLSRSTMQLTPRRLWVGKPCLIPPAKQQAEPIGRTWRITIQQGTARIQAESRRDCPTGRQRASIPLAARPWGCSLSWLSTPVDGFKFQVDFPTFRLSDFDDFLPQETPGERNLCSLVLSPFHGQQGAQRSTFSAMDVGLEAAGG